MFLSLCSQVSVFVPPDRLQLLSVLIYGLQSFERGQRNVNDRSKTTHLLFLA